MSTGWVFPDSQIGDKYALEGVSHPVSPEAFLVEASMTSPSFTKEWLETPIRAQRFLIHKMEETIELDPINRRYRQEPQRVLIDTSVFGPCDNKKLEVFVHRPTTTPGDMLLPAIVYAHGGGGIYSAARHSRTQCTRLADENSAVVLNVEYRLAPEDPAPAGILDVAALSCTCSTMGRPLGLIPLELSSWESPAVPGLQQEHHLSLQDARNLRHCH